MRSQLLRLAAGAALTVFAVGCSTESTSPVAQNEQRSTEGYIVVFKPTAAVTARIQSIDNFDLREREMGDVVRGFISSQKIDPDAVYSSWGTALHGFAANLSSEQVSMLRKHSDVAFIERDAIVQLPPSEMTPEALVDPMKSGVMQAETTPAGILRVNGGVAPGDGKVCWIIDTGIDLDHPDLTVDRNRAKNYSSTRQKGAAVGDDGNGHGTHCAGIVAARANGLGVVGVAPGATVVPVKVLSNSGSGTTTGVINGVNYVAGNAAPGDAANMSLGGGYSASLNNAVINAAARGIRFAVAAGNEGANALNYSPASANHANVWTISAVNANDFMASWSNYGNPPVDFAEPGVSIYSTYKGGSYATLSGTSMAAPHMAGILLFTNTPAWSGTAFGDPDGNPDRIGNLP